MNMFYLQTRPVDFVLVANRSYDTLKASRVCKHNVQISPSVIIHDQFLTSSCWDMDSAATGTDAEPLEMTVLFLKFAAMWECVTPLLIQYGLAVVG
jgi:hypothetical protein